MSEKEYYLLTDSAWVPASTTLTGTYSSNGKIVTGSATSFTTEISGGDWLINSTTKEASMVRTVDGDERLELYKTFTDASGEDVVVVKSDKAKVLYSRIKNSSGADLTIDGQTLPDGEQVEEGKPNSAGFRFKFIKPRYIETSGNTIVDLTHFGRIPRSQSGFVGLLNEYPNAAFAASVRLLDASYTGGLVRVRAYRVIGSGGLDQGEADVLPDPSAGYFISLNSLLVNTDATAQSRGVVDGSTLADLLANPLGTDYDGYVTTWYDQSGNANDASQATANAQPQIASAGSLILENGKPAVQFDGVNDNLLTTATFNLTQTTTISISKCDLSAGEAYPIMVQSTNNTGFRHHLNSGYIRGRFSGTNIDDSGISPSNVHNLFTIINNGTTGSLFWNGTASASGAAALTADPTAILSLGGNSAVRIDFQNGITQEAIVYCTDESSNRTNIETNINTAFSIYP